MEFELKTKRSRVHSHITIMLQRHLEVEDFETIYSLQSNIYKVEKHGKKIDTAYNFGCPEMLTVLICKSSLLSYDLQ